MRTVLALAVLWVAGCGDGADREGGPFPDIPATAGRAEYSFDHDGLVRRFQIYVPADHVEGRALVVVLHGGGGSAKQMFKAHPLEKEADARGIVIVAAQGTSNGGSGFEWNGQVSLDSGVDDIGYLEEVIRGVSTSLSIDQHRRYIAGFSGGASMTVRFGAEKSELVAAIATFAGKVGLSTAGGPFVFPPEPKTPISVQMTYGTQDPNLVGEIKGNVQATSARAGIDWWVESLGCTTTPESEVDGLITRDTFGCPGGGVVRMNTVLDMPHMWPDP